MLTFADSYECTHFLSGMAVECQETHSKHVNRVLALKTLQSRLYEQQLTIQQAATNSMRKLQIGGANRWAKFLCQSNDRQTAWTNTKRCKTRLDLSSSND